VPTRRKYPAPRSGVAACRRNLEAYGSYHEDQIDAVAAAAVLHDVLEDTDYSEKEMREDFGNFITNKVLEVTDVSKKFDGNRAARKLIDGSASPGRRSAARRSSWPT
jgi:(p)ppGpp synthase/HD superfamily hydrolase